MVWSHYTNELRLLDTQWSDDEEEVVSNDKPLEFQEWITEYSDDLLNIWNGVKGYTNETGISTRFLASLDWNEFCEFCYKFSIV